MSKITIKFWGVRGSLARPSKETLYYGGNSPCVEIRYNKEIIICDTGTGIYPLGQELLKTRKNIKASILYSHYHWDHILGLPFFAPIYDKKNQFDIFGRKGLKKSLNALLHAPNFPVKLFDFKAGLKFFTKSEGKFKIGQVLVEAFNVNHPNGAFGYKFIFPNKKSIVFISDNGPQKNNFKIISKIHGADILIHDAQYIPEEFMRKKRFGHSTYHHVLDIARYAGIKKIILFHHDPSRTDKQLKIIERFAQKLGSKICLKSMVSAAREEKSIVL